MVDDQSLAEKIFRQPDSRKNREALQLGTKVKRGHK